MTLLSVAGVASLHAALGAGQGDTDRDIHTHFLRMAMVIIATIDVVVSWSESHTLGDKSDEDSLNNHRHSNSFPAKTSL